MMFVTMNKSIRDNGCSVYLPGSQSILRWNISNVVSVPTPTVGQIQYEFLESRQQEDLS